MQILDDEVELSLLAAFLLQPGDPVLVLLDLCVFVLIEAVESLLLLVGEVGAVLHVPELVLVGPALGLVALELLLEGVCVLVQLPDDAVVLGDLDFVGLVVVDLGDEVDLAGLQRLDVLVLVGDEGVEALVLVAEQLDAVLVVVDVLQPVLVVAQRLLHLRVPHLARSQVLHVAPDDAVQPLHLLHQQVVLAHLLPVRLLEPPQLCVFSLQPSDDELELLALLQLVAVFLLQVLLVPL
jgi:hypothetical protein